MNAIVQAAIDTAIAALPRVASEPLEPLGYGADVKCFESIDPRAIDVDPMTEEGIAQALFHRLASSKGSVIDDDSLGFDLIGLLHHGMTSSEIMLAEQRIRLECEQDDRVISADVTVSLGNAGKEMFVFVMVTPQSPLSRFSLNIIVRNGQVLFDSIGV